MSSMEPGEVDAGQPCGGDQQAGEDERVDRATEAQAVGYHDEYHERDECECRTLAGDAVVGTVGTPIGHISARRTGRRSGRRPPERWRRGGAPCSRALR